MTYTWMLNELASAGRENLDADHVSKYDVKEDAGAQQEVVHLQTHGLDGDAVVVDLGAGTGQFALAVAPHSARVVAVDVSPVMLDLLKEKAAHAGFHNLDVVQAGFLTYTHAGPPGDLVYSRYALHHIPDFWKVLAFQNIRRTLRSGGVLRLWDIVYHFDAAEAAERLESWCATLDEDVEEGWRRSDIEEHVRDEHSTFTWLLEPMMERCGFQIEEAVYSEDGIFAKYVARAV